MELKKNGCKDCRIAANRVKKARYLLQAFRDSMLQCDNARCNSTGKRV